MKNNKTLGFSLIELMVAMAIGLIVLVGLVSLFTSSSSVNRSQTGLSILQENGRYAIARIKQDIESAGRKHCASVAMPSEFITNWDQGYAMSDWQISRNVSFTNGLPNEGDVMMDLNSDPDQLPDTFDFSAFNSYPLDSAYFIRGHECGNTSCTPDNTDVGADYAAGYSGFGTSAGDRPSGTDSLTVRYLTGGARVTSSATNVFTLAEPSLFTGGDALVADCNNSFVSGAAWGGNTVTLNDTNVPSFTVVADTRVYNLDEEFKTVSYFLELDADPNDSSRVISSLYRTENGNKQQLVEGVERLDFFYLAQLQTGHVVRMTADQVQTMMGGGDVNQDGAIDGRSGCILPPVTEYITGAKLANGQGCLWRSIYAVEVHMLLNTVNNSAPTETEPYRYSVDSTGLLTPAATSTVTGLPRERMYRKEFTAIVPIRSYTL